MPVFLISLVASFGLLTNLEVKAQPSPEILLDEIGVLEPGDSALSGIGALFDEYTFQGAAGTPVQINWSSEAFNFNLILLDSANNLLVVLAGGEVVTEPDSRLIQSLDTWADSTGAFASFNVPYTGLYRVLVAAPDATSQGSYSVTISVGAARQNLVIGQSSETEVSRETLNGCSDQEIWGYAEQLLIIDYDALNALVNCGSESVPTLIALFESDDEAVRSLAAYALKRIGSAAVPGLIEVLPGIESYINFEGEVAATAFLRNYDPAGMLVEIGPAAIPGLTAALQTSTPSVSATINKILETINSPDLQEFSESAVLVPEDESEEIRSEASARLESIGLNADASISELVNVLQNHPDAEARATAALALGAMNSEAASAVPLLVNALLNDNTLVRGVAAFALGRIKAEPSISVPALTTAIQDEDDITREVAAEALRGFGAEAALAVPELLEIFQNENETDSIRLNAFMALIDIEAINSRDISLFITALQDKSPDIRYEAISNLHRLEPAPIEAVPALLALNYNGDVSQYRDNVIGTLQHIGRHDSSFIIELLNGSSDEQNIAFSVLVGVEVENEHERAELTSVLITLLQSENLETRRSAAKALWDVVSEVVDNPQEDLATLQRLVGAISRLFQQR
nr:HEAT repeat domain-containing protein [Leptolyngbya sp. FACHB-671]